MIKIRKTSNGGGARGYAFIFEAGDVIPSAAERLAVGGVHEGPVGLRTVKLFTRSLVSTKGGYATFAKDASMSSARRAAAKIIRQARSA